MDGISGNERTIWYAQFRNRIQRKVYLRGVKSSFYVLLDADCVHYFHYVRKIGLIKGNQGRVLSISVEQKYRVLHRRCGGVCVRMVKSQMMASLRATKAIDSFTKNTAKARRRRRKNVSSLFGTRVDASRRWQTLPTARAKTASSSERCCDFRFF